MMSTIYTTNPYGGPMTSQYGYQHAPQPPPSPPADEASRCSLPSISNLLDLADGPVVQEEQDQSQIYAQHTASQPSKLDQGSVQKVTASSNRQYLPPTPPLQHEVAFDGRQSPSIASSSTYSFAAPAPTTAYAPMLGLGSLDCDDPRQRPVMLPRKPSMSMGTMGYASPYHPTQVSMTHASTSYFPTPLASSSACAQVSGLYYQRPLPQFTSSLLPLSIPYTGAPTAPNPWQHHHYISPTSTSTGCSSSSPHATASDASQDRYTCETCSKGFSRPSSLKIHQHSHTGQKPFRCGYRGCGKTFSVRSNMKRHERGCHAFVLP